MSTSFLSATINTCVAFHDCDPMAVVWHGHYFKYFEFARCELLKKIHYDYPDMLASGYLWPVIDARIKYVGAARYGDELTIRAELSEWENRLRIDYLITHAQTGKRLTKGHSIQVAVCAQSMEMQLQSPPVLLEKIQQAAHD